SAPWSGVEYFGVGQRLRGAGICGPVRRRKAESRQQIGITHVPALSPLLFLVPGGPVRPIMFSVQMHADLHDQGPWHPVGQSDRDDGISCYNRPDQFARFRALYGAQLTDPERAALDRCEALSRKLSPVGWAEWD